MRCFYSQIVLTSYPVLSETFICWNFQERFLRLFPSLMTSSQALSGTSMFSKIQDQTSWSLSRVSMPFKSLSRDLEDMKVSEKAGNCIRVTGNFTKILSKLDKRIHVNPVWDGVKICICQVAGDVQHPSYYFIDQGSFLFSLRGCWTPSPTSNRVKWSFLKIQFFDSKTPSINFWYF